MTEQLQVQPGAITGLDGALDIKSSFFEARLLAEVGRPAPGLRPSSSVARTTSW